MFTHVLLRVRTCEPPTHYPVSVCKGTPRVFTDNNLQNNLFRRQQ